MTLEELQKKHLKRMARRKRAGKDWKNFTLLPKSDIGIGTSGKNKIGLCQQRLRVGKMKGSV